MVPTVDKTGQDAAQNGPLFEYKTQKKREIYFGYSKKMNVLYIHDKIKRISWNEYSQGIISMVKRHLSNNRTLSIYIQIDTFSFEKIIVFLFQLYKLLKKYDATKYILHLTWMVNSENIQVLETRQELNELFKMNTELWMLTEDIGGVSYL